jgi:alpha-glucosidase
MRALAAAFLATTAVATAAGAQTVASPDGRIEVTLARNDQGQPTYAVTVAGKPLLDPSTLGIEFERYAKLSNGLVAGRVDRRAGEDRYTLVAAKASRVDDRFREMVVHFAEPDGLARKLDIVVRAYDDGIAIRYRIPRQPNVGQLRIANELTQFAFPADYGCHGLNLGTFGTSHEGEYDPVAASAIRPQNLYELPLVCQADAGPAFAIAEADVENYPASYLTGTETGRLGVQVRLTRRPDDPAIAVVRDVAATVETPWRVVMIGATPGALIENTLVTSLNPAARGDFSWVKPGKTAWDWWSGPVLAGVPKAGTNDATIRGFIDFAAEQKLPYMMIDDGWYVNSGDGGYLKPGADATRTIPDVNMPALVDYAGQRRIGLILWVHWKLLDRDMDRLLPLYAKWGIKGVKVDFMDRDDQEMIGFYHRLAAATARNKLLLDLHGATHPWGMIRTWPNFITQEGVLGAEYNKWTKRITARHNVTLAYTRMLLGPMDYTPGGFRNRTPATFQMNPVGPQVQTTRGHGLGMYVVYDSPLMAIADSPDNYRGQTGVDFLAAVPTSWDETRFLAGSIGEFVAVARRKGQTWYVGAMTNETGRSVTLPLGFLGKGKYNARTWQDDATVDAVVTSEREVRGDEALTLQLADTGGAAAILTPAR